MTRQERRKELINLWFAKYQTSLLPPKHVATILGKSQQTLYRWREKSVGPEYSKDDGKNGSITYAIDTLADYVLNREVKTI